MSRSIHAVCAASTYVWLVAVLIGLLACVGSGQERNAAGPGQPWWQGAQPPGPDSGSGLGFVVRTVVSLLLVLGMILALAYGMNRLGPRLRRRQARHVRIIETVPLGMRRALFLVELGDRRYLIGSTASQLNLLAEVTGQDQGRSPDR